MTRALVRERDGQRCATCGGTRRLAVHHIVPRCERPDLTFEPENLITLCTTCHNRADAQRRAQQGGVFERENRSHPPTVFSLPTSSAPRRSRDW